MGFFYPQWQKITRIGVTTPPTTTGYQVKVEIPWQPGMRDDFADLRFSDYYRTLPYWIETSTTRVTATVWVKLTEINQMAEEFFCYYGNGGASSESNGENVFLFYDHFLGSAVDTNKWTIKQAGTISVANSIITVTGNLGWINTIAQTFGQNTAVRSYAQLHKTTTSYGVGYDLANNSEYGFIRSDNVGTLRRFLFKTGATKGTDFSPDIDENYHVWETKRNSTGLTSTSDGTQVGTLAWTSTTSMGVSCLAEAGHSYYDWIVVRTIQATEPTCTPAESGINTAFYQALLRAKHIFESSYPYTLAVSFVTDHMHLTWTEP